MDPLTLKFKADFLRRVRFCPFLFQCTWEYRAWSAQMVYDYQERLGMIIADDPVVTAEAHLYAYYQVVGWHEDY